MGSDPPWNCPTHGPVFAERGVFGGDDLCPECGLPVVFDGDDVLDDIDLDELPSAGLVSDAAENLARAVAEREEEIVRRAIAITDWNETAVLRIVRHTRASPAVMSNRPTDDDGAPVDVAQYDVEYDIERYSGRAPPVRKHYRYPSGPMEVYTLTKPLVDRLIDEHGEKLFDDAFGGDADAE